MEYNRNIAIYEHTDETGDCCVMVKYQSIKRQKKKSHDLANEGSKKSNFTKITSRMVLTGGGTVDWGRMGKY